MSEAVPPVVHASGLIHSYGKVRALDDVSVDVPAGQMVGLLGPDGVGKSTLLGLISGARVLQQGRLDVLGGNMGDRHHRKLAGPRIAYMPQGLGKNLYDELSVADNLDFFGKLFGLDAGQRRARIERLTRATGLFPFLDRPAAKLSGGMKQKLGLCCALIHDPDLLILDEPTTGVDPLSRRQFWELIEAIRAERAGMSVLVSTAYMDEAERFDWLVAMDAGQVLATGTPAELKARTGVDDLEAAFIRLLPEAKRGNGGSLKIPTRPEGDRTVAISASHLTRRFGSFTAVSDVSFEIEAGEIFGFLGSNGCGKTTTMKMLTGLLPASQGEARLFGQLVDANDLETRKRVGFMSQNFSLYGELTVEQNLRLHARLFALSSARTAERIATLVEHFDLGPHLRARAGSLPLGLRQRLSLAVAVIHEPDMLILDEPTSGVDPVARDVFWELLVGLSREQKVTIFISTHFMNEAMRCDRISLMHAGKVLVYGKPAELAQSKGAHSLEDAFIAYIAEAAATGAATEGAAVSADPAGIAVGQRAEAPAARPASGFSLTRLLAFSQREMTEVMRDPVRLGFAFLGSMLLLIIIAFGITQDVDNIRFAALDLDQSAESRAYLANFSSAPVFSEQAPLTSVAELEESLRAGRIALAFEIPPDFGRDIKRGAKPEVSAWLDGANTGRAGTVETYVTGGHAHFVEDLARAAGRDFDAQLPATFAQRYRYNPTLESIYAMGPSVPPMLLLLFSAILMAVSVTREKEIGTITNFYVTPTSRFEFLFGKQLPYIGIAMINFLLLSGLVVVVLGVPLTGSFAVLAAAMLLYAFAATGFGLLIASMTSSQATAVFAAAILTLLPTVQFSGMREPVSSLEGSARLIGDLWPTTYYMFVSVGTFTKGLGLSALWPDLVALAVFGPVFFGVAMAFLRKQEK